MAFQINKNGEITINGFESGVASSPHKGIANIQGGNIATEVNEVISSYARIAQLNSSAITGTLTPLSQSTVSFSPSLPVNSWFTITVDSGTGLSGTYFYLGSNQISTTFQGPPVTNIITNTSTTTVFLTSGTSWTVPADWNNLTNTVETIGAGGDTPANAGGGGTSGAGGGAYSKKVNLTLTIGASITYQVGAHGSPGTDTYFNGASIGASSVGAKGGAQGAVSATGGQGGQSSSGVGTTKFSGGNGGTASGSTQNGGGGGGAAGPSGAGANGQAHNSGTAGGQGDNGHGGPGGASNTAGSPGTEYDGTHGSGGGGGGADSIFTNGGAGGAYGAGGGGSGNNASSTSVSGSNGLIRITYNPTSPVTTSATYSVRSMGQPLQQATETYFDSSNVQQARYYILDSLGIIWVNDTGNANGWISFFNSLVANMTASPSGLSVLNGWVSYVTTTAQQSVLNWTSTSALGNGSGNYNLLSNQIHATLVGHQGKMYYTDGNFIGSFFPNTSLITGAANIQSYCSYTAPTSADNTIGTVSAIINGSIPFIDGSTRVPAVFFSLGTAPSALTVGTVYYIAMVTNSNRFFQVYSASSGGSALDIATGSVGAQYFNTFYPVSSGGQVLQVFTQQALNLPAFETAQCLAELGNIVLIGGKGNVLYPWDQFSVTPSGLIPLPENNTVNIITVNNTAYVFAGQKGNVYICNGSNASIALSVPDYCAGIPGTPNSYIEPYFSWGGAMYTRGRVWFSILDQTTTKAGNCGGVWSFTPSDNLYIGQDTGQALRLENKSSYGTYSGVCTVLIPAINQLVTGPQYYSGWYSSVSAPSYGIDFSNNIPTNQTLIETDLIPTGTLLEKKTFKQIEYKLATPLIAGETIIVKYRQNGTDSYTSLPTVITENATGLSGYFTVNFQGGQWLQFQIALNPNANTSSSFCRLLQLIIR